MKKFIIAVCAAVLAIFLWNGVYYRLGAYINIDPNRPVTSFVTVEGKYIYLKGKSEDIPFEIRGIDMGAGMPGKWATDYAIDKETYLRWFKQIQEMGANTIRIYTILHDDFYNAFYEYNYGREEPLFLLHGVWMDDYMINSRRDAYDDDIYQTLLEDCRTVVDIIHGKKTLSLGRGNGSGTYRKDISPWVLGYLMGMEWESGFVAYTDEKSQDRNSYSGTYLYTGPNATAFEAMLCQAGDRMIEYESQRYKQQRLMAFVNGPATDPFVYPAEVAAYRHKTVCVDVEHIKSRAAFQAGMFASYHVYPYFPDYLELMDEASLYTEEEINERIDRAVRENLKYHLSLLNAPGIGDYIREEDYYDSRGRYNTYRAYLKALNRYHTIPVIISEYGVTTGRGMAQRDANTRRNQGHMTEQEQGQALVECYQDIMDAGCAGSCLFTWQDEWFKRTWNTLPTIDDASTAYWSDWQTNGQYFGLLSFDPGKERSACYVDGDISEWGSEDTAVSSGDMELSVKYDEKFLYFLVKKDGFDQEKDTLYIPIDLTPKSGSTWCRNYNVGFERGCDFLIVIQGRENSRVMVQKRYEALLAAYGAVFYRGDPYINPPERDSPDFERIYLPLSLGEMLPDPNPIAAKGEKYETGRLRYGNGNPESEEFDSLADFIFAGDYAEIRIPWQMLNFSNPSDMMIHDDYYENYGIEDLHIKRMYVGAGWSDGTGCRIPMEEVPLKGWGRNAKAHERLKKSYYILQEYWTHDGTG